MYNNTKKSSGIFLSSSNQIIKPYESIIFENSINLTNIEFNDESEYITILSPGTYIINLTAQFTDTCEITIFINDIPELSTKIYSDTGIINFHDLLKLNKNDKISIHNTSSSLINTTSYINRLIKESNIKLNIIQISFD